MGLLSRASTLDENNIKEGLAFSDFILKYSFKNIAMLEQYDSCYFITQSIGFDAASIIKSNSSSDFWNGICKENHKIIKFSGDEITPLFQFFSTEMKDKIEALFVYRSRTNKILFSLSEISDGAAEDFENITCESHPINIQALNPHIKENSAVIKLMINFSESIESFLNSEIESENSLYNIIKNSIFNEIYNRFICYYNFPDASIKSNNLILKTIFITGKAYSVELITNHFIFNFRELLGNKADLIRVDYCGPATSCEQIQNFLQAE